MKSEEFQPNECMVCGKAISKNANRCKSCSNKNRKGTYKMSLKARENISIAHKKTIHLYNKFGKEAKHWKGGRINQSQGYKLIYIGRENSYANSKGYILEHHLVWLKENKLGWLYIPEGFIVHHINGIIDDNMIENLACIPRSYHTKLHKSIGGTING